MVSYFEEHDKEKSCVVQMQEGRVFFHFSAVEKNKGCIGKVKKHIYSCVHVV